MTPKLSPRTIQLVEKIFASKDVAEASQWLEQKCGNDLPFCNAYDEFQMERIRFGTIKLSEGEIKKLARAIEVGCSDWRDLLVASGFGNDVRAHEAWAKETLEQ